MSLRKIEDNLKNQDIDYENILTDLNIGYYRGELQGRLIKHNKVLNKILGYELTESLIGSKAKDFFLNEEEKTKYYNAFLEKGFVQDLPIRIKNKNDKIIVLQVNSRIVRDDQGDPLFIEGTFVDITEKFEMEQKLKESEEKFRFLFENMPSGIVAFNSDGIIIDCNKNTEKLFGYKRKELIGRDFRSFSVIETNYVEEINKNFINFFKGIKIPPMDLEVHKKDGRRFWINLKALLMNVCDNNCMQLIISDITENKITEELKQNEIEKLKELDKIRNDLVSNMSHELKTPIMTISGSCELLYNLLKDRIGNDSIEIINIIQRGNKRLQYLVENLIDISRIEYKKLELKYEVIDLVEIINDILKDMMSLINEGKLHLELNLAKKLNVNADKIRIEQVISNLISNAIKNTPPEGTIKIFLREKDNCAIIIVSDTGVGLTKEEQKKIFYRFGKIERKGEGLEYLNIKGSGLGLYISKKIMKLHNGKIWAKSKGRNKGTKLFVKLPINLVEKSMHYLD